jgi:HK97 family phage portal protein
MSLLDIYTRWRGARTPAQEKAQASAGNGYAVLWNAESNVSPGIDQENYLLAYQVSLWTQRCIYAIARACGSVVYDLINKRTDEQVEQHPLLELLDYVNETDDLPWLVASTIGYELLSGNAYWLLDGKGTDVRAIFPLRPDRVEIKPQRDGTLRYVYKVGGKATPYEAEQIIHFRQWNPVNDFYGQSAIQPLETSVNTDKAIREFNHAFLKHQAVPAGMFTAEGTVPPEQQKSAREQFHEVFGGAKNAGKTMFLGGGLKWQQLAQLNKDGGFTALGKIMREEILSSLGVPPVIVGLLDGATYANTNEQKRIFWGDTILDGHITHLLGRVNQSLVPRYSRDLELRPDRTKVEALQENRNEVMARLQPAVGVPYMTVNEARAEAGLDALEDAAADVVYVSGNIRPLGEKPPTPVLQLPPGAQKPAPDEDEEQEQPDEDEEPPPPPAKAFRLVRAPAVHVVKALRYGPLGSTEHVAYMKDVDDRRATVEEPMAAAAAELYLRYMSEVAANLRKWGKAFARVKVVIPDPDRILFDVDAAGKVFSKRLMPHVEAALQLGADAAIAEIGGDAWNMQRPEVVDWLEDKELQVTTLPKTMHADLKAILERGVEDGVGADEIARRIQDNAEDYASFRAQCVARTETVGANNYGALDCYEANGAEVKEWVTANDDLVRGNDRGDEFDHTAAHGEQQKISADFEATGESLQFPGDPAGSAGNICNCRCTLVAVD